MARMRESFRVAVAWALLLFGVVALADYPEVYKEPGYYLYREQSSQEGEDSIDPFTGQLKVRQLDLFLPGNGGLDIKVWRSYESSNIGLLSHTVGVGWTFHFGKLTGQKLEIGSATCNPSFLISSQLRPVFELPDGTVQQFLKAPAGSAHTYISKDRWVADCAGSANGGLVIRSPDGTRFDVTVRETVGGISSEGVWYVDKITDRNGNWLKFSYLLPSGGGYVYVNNITSSDGRNVSFSYGPPPSGALYYLFPLRKLTSITANGQTWTYDYVSFDGEPVASSQFYSLAKVTRPDGKSWQYTYSSLSIGATTIKGYLSGLTEPHGGLKTYTYSILPTGFVNASLIRVTKKTAQDNVNSPFQWTYTYRFNIGGIDITDVVGPDGVTTYRHVAGYSGVSGAAWRLGLLLEKDQCTTAIIGSVSTCDPSLADRQELYEWGSQLISNDQYVRNTGLSTVTDLAGTNAPIMTKKTIALRSGPTVTNYISQYQLHDQYGNPAKIVETGNATRTTDLTYFNDPAKWIIGKVDKETIDNIWVMDRTFDANGNITSVNKYGVVTDYTYRPDGEVASATDARGIRTDYSDYYRSVPRREDQPEGVVITRTVNPTGTVASETNGEGATTSYTYDGLNRVTGITPPTGNPTTIQWSTYVPYIGFDAKVVTRGNFEEVSAFDGFGRVVENIKRDRSGSPVVRKLFQYDALGRKTVESYPTSSSALLTSLPRISYTYDILDRITRITHADNKTRTLQYLPANQVKLTNENGQAYTYTYRSFGNPDERQLMSVAAPVAAANLSITRNSLGQITSMVQNGITRTMQYDTKGFLNKVNHPEIGWVTYTRDAVGNPLAKSVGTAPNTRTISYVHDGRNRLVATTYQDAATPPVSLAYNRVDDVVSASRGDVTRNHAYDLNRNLVTESLLVDGRQFDFSYLYDGNDALSQVTYPDGHVVDFDPDALGRPTAVIPYVNTVTYHPSGQVAAMYYANGAITTQSFNARMWPSQMTVIGPSATLINTAYGYDGLGNVLSMTDGVDASYNRTLTYDAIDRLIGANGPWGTGTLTYDGRGNLLTQVYGASFNRAYAYDTSNRLASYTGSTAFTYDAWGNATRSGTASSYHLYDDASNLYCASCDTASPMSYEYDAANYRVKKTRNGIATYSFYARDGNLMMEYTPSGGDLKQFAYHNKKQVAMRHVVDPALNLGQNSLFIPSRLAAVILRKPETIETGLLPGLAPIPPLLTDVGMAVAN